MKWSGTRGGWAIVIPALVLGLFVLGSSLIARCAEFRLSSLFGGRHGLSAAGRERSIRCQGQGSGGRRADG